MRYAVLCATYAALTLLTACTSIGARPILTLPVGR